MEYGAGPSLTVGTKNRNLKKCNKFRQNGMNKKNNVQWVELFSGALVEGCFGHDSAQTVATSYSSL